MIVADPYCARPPNGCAAGKLTARMCARDSDSEQRKSSETQPRSGMVRLCENVWVKTHANAKESTNNMTKFASHAS
jgi:hypothetical protein